MPWIQVTASAQLQDSDIQTEVTQQLPLPDVPRGLRLSYTDFLRQVLHYMTMEHLLVESPPNNFFILGPLVGRSSRSTGSCIGS